LQENRVLINSSSDIYIYDILTNNLSKFENPDYKPEKHYILCQGNDNKFSMFYDGSIYIEKAPEGQKDNE